jgi:hypothetical protein
MSATTLQILSDAGQQAWTKRRPAWTRNDSVRFLNDGSASVLAWVRRKDPHQSPKHSKAMGRWLMDWRAQDFERAHARLTLAAQTNKQLSVLEVFK